VDYTPALVGLEAGFFDDIVKTAGPFYFLKSEVRVGLVSSYKSNRSDAEDTIKQRPSHTQVDYTEHIEIIHSSIQDAAAPFDSLSGNFVINHL